LGELAQAGPLEPVAQLAERHQAELLAHAAAAEEPAGQAVDFRDGGDAAHPVADSRIWLVPLAQRVPQYQQQQPFAGRNGRQGLGIPRTALEQYRSPPRGQLGVAALPHEQYRTQTEDVGHHHQHDDHQADRPPAGGNQY